MQNLKERNKIKTLSNYFDKLNIKTIYYCKFKFTFNMILNL